MTQIWKPVISKERTSIPVNMRTLFTNSTFFHHFFLGKCNVLPKLTALDTLFAKFCCTCDCSGVVLTTTRLNMGNVGSNKRHLGKLLTSLFWQ